MKFYNSIGPNPRVVKMFMAEKGIDIPRVEVDLMKGENREPWFLKLNPRGQVPTLDDGDVQTAEREVVRRRRTSRSGANYDDMKWRHRCSLQQ